MSERIQNEQIDMLLKEFVEQTVNFYDGLKTGENESPRTSSCLSPRRASLKSSQR